MRSHTGESFFLERFREKADKTHKKWQELQLHLNVSLEWISYFDPNSNQYIPLQGSDIHGINAFAVMTLYSHVLCALIFSNSPTEENHRLKRIFPDFPFLVLPETISWEEAADVFFETALHADSHFFNHPFFLFESESADIFSRLFQKESLKAQWTQDSQLLLKKHHFLFLDGHVTSYGTSKGLFFSCSVNETWISISPFFSPNASKPDVSYDSRNLKDRLNHLQAGRPSSILALQTEMQQITQLLESPLEPLFQNAPEYRQQWIDNALSLEAPLKLTRLKSCRLLDAVNVLGKYCLQSEIEENTWMKCVRMLDALFMGLCTCRETEIAASETQMPLRERLYTQNIPALDICLDHYFYAASQLTESDFPLWLYEYIIVCNFEEAKFTPKRIGELTLHQAIRYGITKLEHADTDLMDFFSFSYNLLAAPFDQIPSL